MQITGQNSPSPFDLGTTNPPTPSSAAVVDEGPKKGLENTRNSLHPLIQQPTTGGVMRVSEDWHRNAKLQSKQTMDMAVASIMMTAEVADTGLFNKALATNLKGSAEKSSFLVWILNRSASMRSTRGKESYPITQVFETFAPSGSVGKTLMPPRRWELREFLVVHWFACISSRTFRACQEEWIRILSSSCSR